ncbi:DUF6527 family protein [Calidifontibacillus oryziterrae]|uniref:DUF6527 family protein n=1 Tax=Calidifontibacillus oryziterrae TaxID=1191699 RepID=UPI0012B57C87|nr:DUF6527 family protein [Calidifontibacillus oryziterrae]
MKLLKTIFRSLFSFFNKNKYSVVVYDELPTFLDKKVLYLIGEKDDPWLAALKCPCGCDDVIQLSLIKHDTPSWKVERSTQGTTLSPSIWRTKGCKSHFFFRDNRIKWCD